MKKKQRKSNTMNARWMKVNFLNFSVADIDIYWLLLFGIVFKKSILNWEIPLNWEDDVKRHLSGLANTLTDIYFLMYI